MRQRADVEKTSSAIEVLGRMDRPFALLRYLVIRWNCPKKSTASTPNLRRIRKPLTIQVLQLSILKDATILFWSRIWSAHLPVFHSITASAVTALPFPLPIHADDSLMQALVTCHCSISLMCLAGVYRRPQVLGIAVSRTLLYQRRKESGGEHNPPSSLLRWENSDICSIQSSRCPPRDWVQLSAVLTCLITYPVLTSCPSLISYCSIPLSALRITFQINYLDSSPASGLLFQGTQLKIGV